MTCSCKIFVMTIQSDYESTSLFSPFQYPLLSLTKEDKGAMKVVKDEMKHPCLNDQLHPIHTTRSFVYGRGSLESSQCVFIQSVQIRFLRCCRNGIITRLADSSESSRNYLIRLFYSLCYPATLSSIGPHRCPAAPPAQRSIHPAVRAYLQLARRWMS